HAAGRGGGGPGGGGDWVGGEERFGRGEPRGASRRVAGAGERLEEANETAGGGEEVVGAPRIGRRRGASRAEEDEAPQGAAARAHDRLRRRACALIARPGERLRFDGATEQVGGHGPDAYHGTSAVRDGPR